jgi:hypothetical protein
LASSSSKNASSSSKQTAKKRKAGGAEHLEAPPAKSIQQQEQVQQETAYYPMANYRYQPQADVPAGPGGDFNFNIEEINFCVDDECMLRADESEQGRRGLQQPISEPKHDVEFIRLPCGPVVPVVAEATVEDMLGPETTTIDVQWRHEQGGEFIQMPCGQVVPVVAEATFEDMLGLGPGPETMYCGEWSGGMATARIPFPWSSYAPTSSSYTACSGLLQGSDPLLQLPSYLMC